MLSGKTTIGKKLSKALGLEFIDTDKYISQKYRLSVEEIFRKYGEDIFRDMEKAALKELIHKENILISTGGGLPCYNNNMELINNSGMSIYIKISPLSILNRLENSKKKRPLLINKTPEELLDFVHKTLKEREVYYNRSKLTIKGEGLNIKEIALNIIRD